MARKKLATFTLYGLQILDEQGRVDKELEPDLGREDLHRLYRAMVLSREADQRMLNLQRQGRIGTFGPGTGQEGSFCGSAFALKEGDWMVGAYRELGARLMRGEPLAKALLLYNGFEEGCSPTPEMKNMLPISIVIPMQFLQAVGIGYSLKYRGIEETAVITYTGDGGTSEGDFHEALNYASAWQVPVVFVVQNNQYAISVPRHKQTRSRTLAQKGLPFEMPAVQVDGNDALGMYVATKEALERAYAGEGPTLIEAVTYRMLMHTTADDPTKYRDQAEVDAWAKKDPIDRFRIYLENKGLWDGKQEEAMRAGIKEEIDAAVAEFEGMKDFRPDACFDHVYGTRHDVIEEQRAHFLAELEKERNDA